MDGLDAVGPQAVVVQHHSHLGDHLGAVQDRFAGRQILPGLTKLLVPPARNAVQVDERRAQILKPGGKHGVLERRDQLRAGSVGKGHVLTEGAGRAHGHSLIGPVAVAAAAEGLQQPEIPLLVAAGHGVDRRGARLGLVQCVGVMIHRRYVLIAGQFEVVDGVGTQMGGIVGDGLVAEAAQRVPLQTEVIHQTVAGEALKFQPQGGHIGAPPAQIAFRVFPGTGGGRLHLFKIVEALPPEQGAEGLVQRADIPMEFFLHGFLELPAADGALAAARMLLPHLVIHLKAQHIGIVPETAAHFQTDFFRKVPENGRIVAVIVPPAVAALHAQIVHIQCFRIPAGHPDGLTGGGGAQHGVNAVLPQPVDDLLQPVEIVHALSGFHQAPAEFRHAHHVEPGPAHILDVLPDKGFLFLFGVQFRVIANAKVFFHRSCSRRSAAGFPPLLEIFRQILSILQRSCYTFTEMIVRLSDNPRKVCFSFLLYFSISREEEGHAAFGRF